MGGTPAEAGIPPTFGSAVINIIRTKWEPNARLHHPAGAAGDPDHDRGHADRVHPAPRHPRRRGGQGDPRSTRQSGTDRRLQPREWARSAPAIAVPHVSLATGARQLRLLEIGKTS